MKTLLNLGYAVVILSFAAPAFGAGSNNAQISTTVAQTCQIDAGTSSLIDLTGAAVNTPVAGTFLYQCNFVGGNTTLRFTSSNGGVLNGANLVNYGIFLNDQTPAAPGAPSPSQWLQASNALSPGVPFSNISVPTQANQLRQPYFYVGLTQPALVAGTYTDTLTITILP